MSRPDPAPAREGEARPLSLCMIVREEEETLARCLHSVAECVDEIVVVDTGSRDRTVEIARSFGARVIEAEWTGSFAAARNRSLDAATGEWILFLDADEVLMEGDGGRLRELTGLDECEGFSFSVLNHTGHLEDATAVSHSALRMFRNRPHYRFEGRLHEQIAERIPAQRMRDSGLRIEHFGYLKEVRARRGKSERNIELLRLQQAESPPSPFLHFNLGSEHAAAGEAQAALTELERAWFLLEDPRQADFAPALIRRLAGSLRACERHEDAIARAQEGLALFPDFTDLVYEQALAATALGRSESARGLLERCLSMGEPPRRYPAEAGCGGHLALVALAELDLGEGEPGAAAALLERCLREHPRHLAAIVPYVSARLAEGAQAESLAGSLQELIGSIAGRPRLVLGQALRDVARPAAAQDQLELVLAELPESDLARVALAETLIAQRLHGEAVIVLEGVCEAGPQRLPAARTRLFALLCSGADPSALAAALERARTAGMGEPELELFRAWGQLASGRESGLRATLAAVPRLLAMLEMLLLAQDFESFELLLGLLVRSALPERERRELLAEMYLRRGFHSSAAEEWMAVAAEAPDVRSMLGLARVASARAMPQEAEHFATAALELGGGETAAALVATLQQMST